MQIIRVTQLAIFKHEVTRTGYTNVIIPNDSNWTIGLNVITSLITDWIRMKSCRNDTLNFATDAQVWNKWYKRYHSMGNVTVALFKLPTGWSRLKHPLHPRFRWIAIIQSFSSRIPALPTLLPEGSTAFKACLLSHKKYLVMSLKW